MTLKVLKYTELRTHEIEKKTNKQITFANIYFFQQCDEYTYTSVRVYPSSVPIPNIWRNYTILQNHN